MEKIKPWGMGKVGMSDLEHLNDSRVEKALIFLSSTDEEHAELSDRKSTRLNSSHSQQSRMPSSA